MIEQSCRVKQGGVDVGRFEEGIVGEDFLVRCARRQQFQEINHAETHPADARAAAALIGIDRDAIKWLHA